MGAVLRSKVQQEPSAGTYIVLAFQVTNFMVIVQSKKSYNDHMHQSDLMKPELSL